MALNLACLLSADRIIKAIGPSGLQIIAKVAGVLLTGLAVQLMILGFRDLGLIDAAGGSMAEQCRSWSTCQPRAAEDIAGEQWPSRAPRPRPALDLDRPGPVRADLQLQPDCRPADAIHRLRDGAGLSRWDRAGSRRQHRRRAGQGQPAGRSGRGAVPHRSATVRNAVASAEASLSQAGQAVGASTAEVAAAEANVARARADLRTAEDQSNRVFHLVERGVYPAARGDESRRRLEGAGAGVEQANAQLEEARQNLGPLGADNPQIRVSAAACSRRASI